MERIKERDRWFAVKYNTIPNAVSPMPHDIFGLNDVDDYWYLNTTYKDDMKNG
jgi:hypothetical protein